MPTLDFDLSEYCRDYRRLKFGQEFPFVPYQDLGQTFYPKNLAADLPLTIEIDGSQVSNLSPYIVDQVGSSVQLTDQDYCCAPDFGNFGYRCGVHFRNTDNINVTVNLPKMARVNEVITSWRDPCNFMPKRYNILYLENQGPGVNVWQTQARATDGNTPCNIFPSEYFHNQLIVTFNR